MVTGRLIFEHVIHYSKPAHDIYTFALGVHVIWGGIWLLELAFRKCRQLSRRASWKADFGALKTKAAEIITIIMKVAYLFVVFGIVMPYLFALIVNLYFIMPWRRATVDPWTILFFEVLSHTAYVCAVTMINPSPNIFFY